MNRVNHSRMMNRVIYDVEDLRIKLIVSTLVRDRRQNAQARERTAIALGLGKEADELHAAFC